MQVSLLLLITVSLIFIITPNTVAQTENVKILNYSYYMDMLNDIVIIGEAQNTGPNVVDYVLISGIITGSDGSQSQSSNRAWAANLLSN